jgi:hypothetical protein
MPTNPNNKRRCQMTGLGDILGVTGTAATPPQRMTLKGNYAEPRLPFQNRMKWLANVQRLAAQCRAEKRPHPHKLIAVANIIAHIGDVCRLSFDGIAARAGCCINTAQACVAWLEEQGAITWHHTARRLKNGKMARSANLYTVIENFRSAVAMVARTVRAIWRERSRAFPDGNACHGMTQEGSYIDRQQAQLALTDHRKRREAELLTQWRQLHLA